MDPICDEVLNERIVAIVTMFSSLLLGNELAKLRRCDLRFGREDDAPFVTVFISRPKTDHAGKGVYRSLVASGERVCVVKSLLRWANRNKWGPASKGLVFRNNISSSVGKTLEWIIALKGIPTKLYSSHSMRAGGATHLYLSKAPPRYNSEVWAMDKSMLFGLPAL